MKRSLVFKTVTVLFSFLSVMVLISLIGCQAKVVKPEAPTATVTEVPTLVPTPTVTPTPTLLNYKVRRGDCLWRISEKPVVYGNPWYWPLLYKTNHDQIADPNIIYPGQNLAYSTNYDDSSKLSARKQAEAAEWPIYKRSKELQ